MSLKKLSDPKVVPTSRLTAAISGKIDKAEFTALGGLLVGTGVATLAELAVGADTYVLTADSAEPTGSKYAPLTLENRTSDPGSPAVGQLWLRTDL